MQAVAPWVACLKFGILLLMQSAGNLFIEKGVDNIFVLHGGTWSDLPSEHGVPKPTAYGSSCVAQFTLTLLSSIFQLLVI